jgi:hypothetical protein
MTTGDNNHATSTTAAAARPSRRLRLEWLWMAGVLLVVLVGLWWFPTPRSGADDSHSTRPRGKKFFHDLLEARGLDPVRHVKTLLPESKTQALDPQGRVTGQTLLVLGPARYPKPDEWKALADWVKQGNTLIFAARLNKPAVDMHPFPVSVGPALFHGLESLPWIIPDVKEANDEANDGSKDEANDGSKDEAKEKPKAGSNDGSKDEANVEANDEAKEKPKAGSNDEANGKPKMGRSGRSRRVPIRTKLADADTIRWFSNAAVRLGSGAKGAQVLVSSERGPQAVRLPVGDGLLVVVASDEVFTNRAMVREGSEAFLLAWRLVEQRLGRDTLYIDEHLNYTGTPQTVGLLFDPLFRPITMQILLVAVLFGWLGSRRFGPPRPPADPPRRSIVEHAEALGNLQYRTGAAGHAVTAYLDWWRHELHLQGGHQSQAELINRLAHLAQREPGQIAQLLHDASRAAQTGPSVSRATVMIRELARLRQLLTRHTNRKS